jgi:uncharacterized membrane protein YeiH
MDFLYLIDLLGVFVFAISGALAAGDKDIDVFGVGFTGFVTAIGGGSLRDIFLNVRPVWVEDGNYLLSILCGVLIAIIFYKQLARLRRTFSLFDAIGIAFFTIVGLQKSLEMESNIQAAVVLGVFSAIMGGVTRDTLMNEKPLIFRKEIYATACLSGAILYIICDQMGMEENLNACISASFIFAARILSVRFRVSLPIVGG